MRTEKKSKSTKRPVISKKGVASLARTEKMLRLAPEGVRRIRRAAVVR
jgi:hypothetical protein